MYAYKGFEPDLSCRGYRFVMGKNVTPEANCASNGFHCAEDPLDCLTYYSDMDRSIYCLVQPGGDIDEDDRDSKIACTELTILRQLTRKEFFLHALAYMVDHPCRKVSGKVQREHSVSRNGYAIVRGKEPAACGKLGDILAFARERRETEVICQIAVAEVDGEKIQPGVSALPNRMRIPGAEVRRRVCGSPISGEQAVPERREHHHIENLQL